MFVESNYESNQKKFQEYKTKVKEATKKEDLYLLMKVTQRLPGIAS